MGDSLRKLPERIKDFCNLSKGNVGGAIEAVASEVVPFLGAVRPVIEETDKIRLSHLLVGLKHGNDFDFQIEKLYDYIDKPEKASYVVSMFRESLMSSSHIVNTIMGIQLSKMIGGDSDITQEDLIIYDALISFNDFDAKNYKLIYELTQNDPFRTDDGICINDASLRQLPNYDGLMVTVSKSEKVGLFTYLPAATYDEGEMKAMATGSFYLINKFSKIFYDMISEAFTICE